MSRGERKGMIRRDHPGLSLSRQCNLLSISRSSFYYQLKGESPENLVLMRRIDELFLELRSNLVFGPSESSGDQIGLCYLDTVFELYSGYHLGQIIEAA